MKKFKLLPVLLLSIITVFSVTGCDEEAALNNILNSTNADDAIEEYHQKYDQSTEMHFKLTDEFIKCLYEEDPEHFDRLYDIQDEIDDQVFNLIGVIGTLKNEESQRIIGILDNAYMSTAPEITDDKIIFPMMNTFRTDRKTRYNIDVMLYVNLESGKKPSMEEYGTDYTVNIDCRYEKEFADSDNYCLVDGTIYHTELGNVIANEKMFADNKVWSHANGIIEEKERNNESEYCSDIPDPDPIESQPDGDYDYAWYDEDSRVVSGNTTDTVDPEASLPADLKADIAMLRAMGYNPEKTNWGWKCEIYAHLGSKYYTSKATLSYAPITGLWEARWVDGWYENNHGRLAHAGTTLYSDDLINFYDVIPGRGSNRTYTKHFMLTRDGVLAIEF